jgi:hypothetical protein
MPNPNDVDPIVVLVVFVWMFWAAAVEKTHPMLSAPRAKDLAIFIFILLDKRKYPLGVLGECPRRDDSSQHPVQPGDEMEVHPV